MVSIRVNHLRGIHCGELCSMYSNWGAHTIFMRLALPVTEMGSLHQASHLVCSLLNIGRRFRARYLEASRVTCTPKYLNEATT